MSQDKRTLRLEMKQIRGGLPVGYRREASERIRAHLLEAAEWADRRAWFVYVSFRDEVATRGLIDSLSAPGRTVYVPRVESDGRMRAVAFPGWVRMVPDRLGFPAPPADAAEAGQLDICLAPGLAFTLAGDRLGYGRGHYDRFLQQRPGLTAVGLAFACQIVPRLPREKTDHRMDWLVSEQGLLRTGH